MEPNPLYAACVRRAAQLLGGYDRLGAELGVSARTLHYWSKGVFAPGEQQFLKIVDIVLDEALRQRAPPAPREAGQPQP